MAFALLGTIALKMSYSAACVPRLVGTLAQGLSCAFVVAGIGWKELEELSHVLWPAVLLLKCYSLGKWGIGLVLRRAEYFGRKEALLATTPAGDMALISADMGIQNVNLIILQVLRLITVFPSILRFVDSLFG